MYKKIGKIHLIGIGGIGMSGIAELLVRNGYTVTGSDLGKNENVRRLETLGVQVYQGHDPLHVKGAEVVVYSSAVKEMNPEYAAAVEQGIVTIPRAEMLAELMRMKTGIAVAGAHGKTTTTSMISVVLMEGGLDPTIVVGGRMDNFGGTNARLGSGDYMVVEADESDGSFNRLSPCIAIVTNLDREHMDFYGNMRTLRSAFVSFLNKIPFYGLSILCGDDPHLRVMAPRVDRRKVSYGFGNHNLYQALSYSVENDRTICRVKIGNETETLRLRVPGKHNALNALAALAVGDELSIPRKHTLQALESFEGVQRRFQKRGEKGGVLFIDDYAHHPSEIRATLAAARERFPKAKIRAIFQPHRFTRTADLFDEFSTCFKDCDAIAVTDIYPAGEMPIPGIHGSILAENLKSGSNTDSSYFQTPAQAMENWITESKPGDVILTLGAGDIPALYKNLF